MSSAAQGFLALSLCGERRAYKVLARLRKGLCGHASASEVPAMLFSLPRLFKLKKRYRNVLDTMFELLPRMARYCLPLGLQVQAVRGSCRGPGKREQGGISGKPGSGTWGWSSKRQNLDPVGPLGSSGLAELSSGEGRELSTYHLCLRSQVRGHL